MDGLYMSAAICLSLILVQWTMYRWSGMQSAMRSHSLPYHLTSSILAGLRPRSLRNRQPQPAHSGGDGAQGALFVAIV